MQIELVLKGVQLGRYARERVEHKLARVTERYHRDIPVRVVVEDNKGIVSARVTTAVNHRDLVGQAESRSVLEALDEAIVKFDRQILKLSDKIAGRGKSFKARRGDGSFESLLDAGADGSDEAAEAEGLAPEPA
jgi:ribosomal subunit interface protein